MSDIVNLEFWFSINFVIDEAMMHDKWTCAHVHKEPQEEAKRAS